MRKFRNPAILLGGGSITGLGVIRNLGKNGVDVYYVSEQKDETIFSKYCKKYFIIPNIEHDIEVLRSFLARLEKEIHSCALIFPGSDLFCLNLSYLKDKKEMGNSYYAIVPSKEIVEILVNKKKFYQSLDKHKILHPLIHSIESFVDLKKISKEVNYPVYLRPSVSPIFREKFLKKGFVARSEEELMKYYMLASKYNIDVMIQEIIPGPAENLFGINCYFDKDSNPRGFFAYQRLREWPHRFGNSSLMESISISDVSSIRETTANYLHSLRYHGIMDAEFKKDPRDGNFKFLEVNARSWWQNSFPTKCGINLVFMAYLDAIGYKIGYVENYEVGVKWICFFDDLRSSIKMFKDGDMTVWKWLSSLRRINDWASFSMDDRLPWIASQLFLLSSILSYGRAHKYEANFFL